MDFLPIIIFKEQFNMSLVKIKEGLIESDNFYMYSDFDNFIGGAGYYRNENGFFMETSELIEREFLFEEFVVQIKKETWDNFKSGDSFVFFIQDKIDQYGIEENFDEQDSKPYYKIIFNNNYLQTYISDDGKEWTNIGGVHLDDSKIIKQGFMRNGDNVLKLEEYILASDPYLTLKNLPEESYAKLLDSEGNIIIEKDTDSEGICKIFLNYFGTDFNVEIYDKNDQIIENKIIDRLNYGDTYLLCEYDFEIIYKDQVLNNDKRTLLNSNSLIQEIILKNKSDVVYNNLEIKIEGNDNVFISLSNNDNNPNNSLLLDSLDSKEEISLFIYLDKKYNNDYLYNKFNLMII
ncbi:hypothetical protein Bp8pS_138 [Bacillus phage vB_BpuM-BpSp]|nr:hypothetical protein Bp8pS_138 [Bacillus phage vB_BpuM-BpSp]